MQGLAVHARRKADEQRLFEILHKLEVEDPCFIVERHPTTNETVIRGIGEMHLRAKLTRLAQQYKLELDTKPPQIAYREAITATAEGHCRHKKQSGGAGPVRRSNAANRATRTGRPASSSSISSKAG
jgi:elongation factor G